MEKETPKPTLGEQFEPVSYTHLDVYKRQGLIYDSQAPPRRRYVRQKTEAQQFREDRQRCYRVLSDYYYLLKKWEADNSPRTLEEEPHPRFVEAIQKKTYVEYLLDLFLYESEEEQRAWIAEHTAEITHLERRLKIMAENKPTNRERLREITDGIEQGIKEPVSYTHLSTAIFVPFTTQELFQNGKEALYYGINALSNNLIMVDRKLLKNPNGLILGTPGSGKMCIRDRLYPAQAGRTEGALPYMVEPGTGLPQCPHQMGKERPGKRAVYVGFLGNQGHPDESRLYRGDSFPKEGLSLQNRHHWREEAAGLDRGGGTARTVD